MTQPYEASCANQGHAAQHHARARIILESHPFLRVNAALYGDRKHISVGLDSHIETTIGIIAMGAGVRSGFHGFDA